MNKILVISSALLLSLACLAQDFDAYLDCSGQHDSTWRGYNVIIKKLDNGDIVGSLLKERVFRKDIYSPVFTLKKEKNTYSSSKYGIEFTVFKDTYSGTLQAEAYSEKYVGPSILLCSKSDDLSYQIKYSHHADVSNLIKLEEY